MTDDLTQEHFKELVVTIINKMSTLVTDGINVDPGDTFTLATAEQPAGTDTGNVVIKGADKVSSSGQGGSVIISSGEAGSSGTAGEVQINSTGSCNTLVGNSSAEVLVTGSSVDFNGVLEVTQTSTNILTGRAIFTPTALPTPVTAGTLAMDSSNNTLNIFDGGSWRVLALEPGNHLAFNNGPPAFALPGTTLASFEVLVQNVNNVTQTGNTDETVLTIDSVEYKETAVAGVATFTTVVSPVTVGGYSVTTRATSNTIIPTSPTTLTVVNESASKLQISSLSQSTAVAGSVLTTFTVDILTPSDLLVTSDNSTLVTVDGVSLTLGGTTSATASSGVATFSLVTAPELVGTLTIRATSSPVLTSDDSDSTIAIEAAAANKLVFDTLTQITSAPSTTLDPFTVRITDEFGNTILTDNSTDVTVNGGALTLTGTLVATASSGVATFSSVVSPSSTGSLTLTATSSPVYTSGDSATSITILTPMPVYVLSSDSSPPPWEAFASSRSGSTNAAWKAFNNTLANINDLWECGANEYNNGTYVGPITTAGIDGELLVLTNNTTAYTVVQYTLHASNGDNPLRTPEDWTILATNDTSDPAEDATGWVAIASETGQINWSNLESRVYTVPTGNQAPYQRYAMVVERIQSSTRCHVASLRFQ